MPRRWWPAQPAVPPMVGASFTDVTVSAVLVAAVAVPFVSDRLKMVAVVPPGATWFWVGVNTSPSSAACTPAAEPDTV